LFYPKLPLNSNVIAIMIFPLVAHIVKAWYWPVTLLRWWELEEGRCGGTKIIESTPFKRHWDPGLSIKFSLLLLLWLSWGAQVDEHTPLP
jgi:hypothetical protein